MSDAHSIAWTFDLCEDDDGKLVLKCTGSSTALDQSINSDPNLALTIRSPLTPPPSATLDIFAKDNRVQTSQVDVYDQLFGAFYGVPLEIPTTTVSETLTHCDALLEVSDHLSITPLIATQISNVFNSHRQHLYAAIARDPARYLVLAIRIRDTAIYTEAIIHIVGRCRSWPQPWHVRLKALSKEMIEIIKRKARELDNLVLETQNELLTLTINNPNGEPITPSASSATDFNSWFIISIFRDTLVREFNAIGDETLKRGDLFRAIGKGGDAYMPFEETRALVAAVMPCALETLREDLDILKDSAKDYVEDVVKNRALVDIEKEGVGWLTCVEIKRGKKGDVLWEREADEGEDL